MKAIKVEVFLQPQFIKAAQQYLNTDGTLFMTVLQNGLLVVSTNKDAITSNLASLAAYVGQYSDTPIHIIQSPVTYESIQNATR